MTLPSEILDLTDWKLTLPVGSKNKPTEIKQPSLATYDGDWFKAVNGPAVQFRAPVNGVTTSGSSNPRSELRELNPAGDWSSTDGKTHTLVIDQAITHLPNARTDGGVAGVVAGQIHDADDDICVFRLEGTKLYVTNGDTTHYALADANYVLGTRFKAMFVVSGGVVSAFYSGRLVTTITKKFSGAYFKAGAYTQANSSNSKPNDATNYGEVVVYGVTVAHGATVPPVVVPPVEVPPVPASKNITVMIARHGEKPDSKHKGFTDITYKTEDSHSLTANGWIRARDLGPDVFGTGSKPIKAGLVRPDEIVAADGEEAGERMKQTGSFLAPELGLALNLAYDKGQEKQLAAYLKTRAGKAVLVIWEHGNIPALVGYLGTTSPKMFKTWPDDRYDVILALKSTDGGKTWSLTQVLEAIGLPGEQKTPIK